VTDGNLEDVCRIVIVGMMGSGKTTIGKLLAKATGWPRYDNDLLLDQLYGMTPRQILEARGERALREAEDAALAHGLQAAPPAIVDAAAGAITSEASRDLLSTPIVVWLRASPETLARRAAGAAHRPWLQGGEEWFRTTALDRHELYASVADVQVDTDDRSPAEVAGEILDRLREICPGLQEEGRMSGVTIGVLLWNMAPDWPTFERAARRVDELGYDHIWTWDHLHAIFGEPQQPVFDGWMSLAAWAKVTSRVRLGLLVGANTFRNPGLVAKMATTLDHLSDGRAILGLGGAWFRYEHTAHGIEFGQSPGERLKWLDESAAAIRAVLDGGSATSEPDAHYSFSDLRQEPLPSQSRLPIMIGGSGEKKTLRTVARYADMWNMSGTPEVVHHKMAVLDAHCEDVGRDPAAIERTVSCKLFIRDTEAAAQALVERTMAQNRTPMDKVKDDETFWIGTPVQIADRLLSYREVGVSTFIPEIAAPYDDETLERMIGEVKPLVDRG